MDQRHPRSLWLQEYLDVLLRLIYGEHVNSSKYSFTYKHLTKDATGIRQSTLNYSFFPKTGVCSAEFKHHWPNLQKEVSPEHYTFNKQAGQKEHGSGNACSLRVKEINHRSSHHIDQEQRRTRPCSVPGMGTRHREDKYSV